MAGISKKQRNQIYQKIKSLGNIWGYRQQDNVFPKIDAVEFLDRIWSLRLMASSDPRFKNAAEDARQHLINNDDWDDDYTFLDRFKLLDCSEEEFSRFIDTVVSLDVRIDDYEAMKYVSAIEDLLPDGYSFQEYVDDFGRSQHRLVAEKAHNEYEYPIGLQENKIKFFVDQEPNVYPSFFLSSDNWDDYGFKTSFKLYYKEGKFACNSLGIIKIFKEDEDTTIKVIPDNFTTLPDSFCSLMQTRSGYTALKRLRPNDYKSILFALRDAAYFSEISERFETMNCFRSSLLRNIDTDTILHGIKREIERGDQNDNWDFQFSSDLPYTSVPVSIKFNFGDLGYELNFNRIKALIGPNGAGKTSILKSLVDKLIRGKGGFYPSPPVFNKIITISFSIFDTFINLRGRSILNYTYCGLHNTEDSVMSVIDREKRLKVALKWINNSTTQQTGFLLRKFTSALSIFFPQEWIDSIYTDDGLDIKKVVEDSKRMSSGESMILNLVASLYASIRKNSLIVFDELEVHLHPRAIRQMMSLLFRITQQFDSACILATHSSIVVQELLADNVTIVEKVPSQNEDGSIIWSCETRQLNRESLAENLSAVSNEIFGEADIQPNYKKFIRECADAADSFDKLLNEVTSDGLPPSLPLYLTAREAFETAHKK